MYAVSFINQIIGIAVGSNGTIIKTTNGGTTWISRSSGTTNDLSGISFSDENNGTAVGSYGTILHTTNGGTTWTNQTIGTQDVIHGVSFTDNYHGWVVGAHGTILHTTNGGVTFIEDGNNFTQPKAFLLEQNYPNPFNPNTKIGWQSPVGSWQTLKVYDILGNEVATLVDEYRNAGSYEIDFNPAASIKNLSSGIYFYQLRVGDPSPGSGQGFVKTKKMVLLK